MAFSFGEGTMILCAVGTTLADNTTCEAYPAYPAASVIQPKPPLPGDRCRSGSIPGEKRLMWGSGIEGRLTYLLF